VSLFASHSREQLRAAYREAWRRWRAQLPLQPLEAQLAELILEHPEYHQLLQQEPTLSEDLAVQAGGVNPFLHLGLHMALREQLGTDRPHGIAAIHRRLGAQLGSAHAAEHRMLEVLAETLWEAQRSGLAPQDQGYLERLRRL
jgi:hypothetical protein